MLWFRRGYTEDEILNAENENDLYDHKKALESAKSAIADRIAANRRLHRVLQTSQARSQEFGEFEELVKEASRVRRHG
jgi:hypothetical protein